MEQPISLSELQRRGVVIRADEAVAIAQTLVRSSAEWSRNAQPPLGPPTLDNVELHPDGSAVCTACAVTPAVSEIAILLDQLLPAGTPGVPGGVRYTIGRALLEVEAPPFDSLDDFARALARFAPEDCAAVIRDLVTRGAQAEFPSPWSATLPERRRGGPAAAELRRQLRESDRQLYEAMLEADAAELQALPRQKPPSRGAIVLVAAATLAAAVGLAAFVPHHLTMQAPASVASRRATAPEPAPQSTATPSSAAAAPSTVAPILGTPAADAPEQNPAAPAAADVATPAPLPASGAAGSNVERRSGPPAARPIPPDRPVADASHMNLGDAPREEETPGSRDTALVAADGDRRPTFPPSFASSSAAFFADASEDGASSGPDGDRLRVMTIGVGNDGSKNYHVQPSPDGRLVAFDSDREGDRGVFVANRDGTQVHRVSGPGYAAVPSWSPDGTRLAFSRAEPGDASVWNLWTLDLASGTTRRLTHYRDGQTWSASWFSDGRRLCYTHGTEIIVLDLDSGRTREFLTPVKNASVSAPVVSPDGSRVAFRVERHGGWLLDLADGSMVCMLTDPTAGEFAWAPDGRRVAFHSRRDDQWGVYVMGR